MAQDPAGRIATAILRNAIPPFEGPVRVRLITGTQRPRHTLLERDLAQERYLAHRRGCGYCHVYRPLCPLGKILENNYWQLDRWLRSLTGP